MIREMASGRSVSALTWGMAVVKSASITDTRPPGWRAIPLRDDYLPSRMMLQKKIDARDASRLNVRMRSSPRCIDFKTAAMSACATSRRPIYDG